jgi:hypothetical protein
MYSRHSFFVSDIRIGAISENLAFPPNSTFVGPCRFLTRHIYLIAQEGDGRNTEITIYLPQNYQDANDVDLCF